MAEPTSPSQRARAESMAWRQTALPLESSDAGVAGGPQRPSAPASALQHALGAVDHAPDGSAQREALARIYAELAEQAIARGRRPAPKRPG